MSNLTSYYTDGHRGYTASKDALNDSRIANLVDALRVLPKGSKILDVGCGDMSLSRLLPEYHWTGIDLDTSKDPRIIGQDLARTPYLFPDRAFDAVVCSEVLEHLFDPVAVLREARRLCKSLLVITVPNLQNLDLQLSGPNILQFDPDNTTSVEHIRWYTPTSLISMVEREGFTAQAVIGNSPHLSRTLTLGRMYLHAKYPEKSFIELDQLIGNILPGHCPGMLLVCCAS